MLRACSGVGVVERLVICWYIMVPCGESESHGSNGDFATMAPATGCMFISSSLQGCVLGPVTVPSRGWELKLHSAK